MKIIRSRAGSFHKYIGKQLSDLRRQKGLAQKVIGNIAGVSIQQIQKYEKGVNRIPIENMLLFAKTLGVDISYFYEKYDNKALDKVKPIVNEHEEIWKEIARNFIKIKNMEHLQAFVSLMRAISGNKAA